jgi:hypothetical protein
LLLALAELYLENKVLAASFYKKSLAITTDNHTLLAAIAYYLDIK